MKTVEKIFISVGLIIILLISGGVYINNKIDKVLDSASGLGVFLVEQQSAAEGFESSYGGKADSDHDFETKTSSGNKSFVSGKPSASPSDLVFDNEVEAIIQKKLDKPIERNDKIKVALILIRNLSVDDITYFYDLATQGHYSSDDIQQARNILKDKLNEEELNTLRSMAREYGLTL